MTKNTKSALDLVRGTMVTPLYDDGGQLTGFGYIYTEKGLITRRIWIKEILLDLLSMGEREFKARYKVKDVDTLVADLDIMLSARGIQAENLFTDVYGGEGWRWTPEQREAYGDSWREYWEPLGSSYQRFA